MQADLWKKVEALYQAALAQPPEERAAFLLQACPDDPQLRGEVQSLLDQQRAERRHGHAQRPIGYWPRRVERRHRADAVKGQALNHLHSAADPEHVAETRDSGPEAKLLHIGERALVRRRGRGGLLAHVKVAARYGKRRDWQRKRALATSHHKNVSRHWPKSVHRYSRWSGCPDSRSSAGLDWQLTAVCAVPQSGNFARMFCRCFREEDTGKPPSDDRITCCGLGTSAASTRLWLCYALRVLTPTR